MPNIIPIKDLKNTAEISALCHKSEEPIFVTKNGYGDMVIMSMKTYEKSLFFNNVYEKLEEAKLDLKNKKTCKPEDSVKRIKEKYGL
ncbi:type II toxin-antitoxin system Phd/YefM family antitoxin [Spirochaetota bacterium]